MATCADCAFGEGVPCVRAEHILLALPLKLGAAARENSGVPGLWEAVRKASCESGYVPDKEAREIAGSFLCVPVFGRSGNKPFAEAVVDYAMARWPDSEQLRVLLLQDTLHKIDKALGRISGDSRVKAYQFAETNNLLRYVLQDIVHIAKKRVRELNLYDRITPDGKLGEPGRELADPASHAEDVAKKMAFAGFYMGVRKSDILYASVVDRELEVIAAALRKIDENAKLKDSRRELLTLGFDIARRAILGEAGYCVLMFSGIGEHQDAPPVNLATRVNSATARTFKKYRDNATMLNQQLSKWLDQGLLMLGEDSVDRARWGALLRSVERDRRQRFDVLKSAVHPLEWPEHRIARYLGPPTSDATDRIDGRRHVDSGWGIAQLSFMFGVLDPNSQEYPGLRRLLLYDSKQGEN